SSDLAEFLIGLLQHEVNALLAVDHRRGLDLVVSEEFKALLRADLAEPTRVAQQAEADGDDDQGRCNVDERPAQELLQIHSSARLPCSPSAPARCLLGA